MRRSIPSAFLVVLAAAFALPARADVKLPAIFGDHMVLQQDLPVPVWGTADAGEPVTVSINGQKVAATPDPMGHWKAVLQPLKAGGPFELAVAGKNAITLKDVLVGEVWVGSGQSNMEFHVSRAHDAEKEIAAAKFPRIRLFTVKKKVAAEPQSDCEGSWSECTPASVPDFSAVAYFFGREIHKTLDVPVGLIHTSWGGTPAEAWTSRPALEADPDFKPILERWDHVVAVWPEEKAKHDQAVADWKAKAEKAKADKKKEPPQPPPPLGPDNPHRASGLYNGMLVPIIPYAVRGAIWYQGEGNAGRAYQYRKLFPAMIADWRKAWGEGDFPFLFVQLANFKDTKPEPADDDWAELREAQHLTLKASPNTGEAVIIDIGEAKDIHPKNKQEVGRRLALQAQAVAYGKKDVVCSGPVYESMKAEEGKIRLTFKSAGGGLVAGAHSGAPAPLQGFAIAGEDKKFVWAEAKIDGETVVVGSDKVAKPVAVRYAWASNPVCNLYNKEGLPASPFRTDEWPGITKDNR